MLLQVSSTQAKRKTAAVSADRPLPALVQLAVARSPGGLSLESEITGDTLSTAYGYLVHPHPGTMVRLLWSHKEALGYLPTALQLLENRPGVSCHHYYSF